MWAWDRYQRQIFWMFGVVAVIWTALVLVTPPGSLTTPREPSGATMPNGCPRSAPNAAAGCVIGATP